MQQVQGHSNNAYPIEIFSIWNDTDPIIDGNVQFSLNSMSAEWSAASVNWMYNRSLPEGKLLLQNTDDHLYVGMDMINFQDDPETATLWGAAVYLDRDHNGILSDDDRRIRIQESGPDVVVSYDQYINTVAVWQQIDWELAGDIFSNLIISNMTYSSSVFEANPHHQYEFRIPMGVLKTGPGKVVGIGFEAYTFLADPEAYNTWPNLPDQAPGNIYNSEATWGDLYLGKNESLGDNYAQYVIEENVNINDDAIGPNNYTFMSTGDIHGDGGQELIVSSNRTIAAEDEYLAIYNYTANGLTKIWYSPDSSHNSNMFVVTGIATYDFDENGEDEIYLVGDDNRILCLYSWNESIGDFDYSKYVYTHATRSLTGCIDIGDVNYDGTDEIVVATNNTAVDTGAILFLSYENATRTLQLLYGEYTPPAISGSIPEKVTAIKIADMDSESTKNEIIILCQTTDNDTLGTTRLLILERGLIGFQDNTEDDLPGGSHANTEDRFGHTILVDDVDNDATNEIIIVGRDYLRIFGANTFVSGAPITLLINKITSLDTMGGGAVVGDLDDDSVNELIVGCANGTILVLNITDSGSDNLSYTEEWSSDLGTSPGYHESMLIYDFDQDTENELFFGDNFGQIISLGKSQAPMVSISSHNDYDTEINQIVEVGWDVLEDLSMHHFDISVDGSLQIRTGANQTSMFLNLDVGLNNVTVNGWDVTGKNNSDMVIIEVSLDAPEVTILTPENNFVTDSPSLQITYENFDINDDFSHYMISLNGAPLENTSAESYQITFDSGDGIYTITVVGVDLLENTGQASIFVTYDGTDPLLTIDSPNNGDAVNSSTINLEWTASDALSGIDEFDVLIDNVEYTTTTSSSQIVPLNGDKEYKFDIIAYDVAGNDFTQTIYVTKDTINPFVNITSPISGLLTGTTSVTVNWDANDNIGGTDIENTKVTVNGVQDYFGSLTSHQITTLSEGINDIIVTTYDYAGNTAIDHIVVIVDTTNPYLEILSPVNNYNTSFNELTIYWKASDNESGIDYYQIFRDSGLIETIDNAGITYATVIFPFDGSYEISVNAVDYLGHSFQDSINVTYDSSAPAMEITTPIEPYYYSSSTNVTLEWDLANIENITLFEIYFDGVLNQTILTNSTRSFLLVFDETPIDQFPVYNVTLVVRTTNSSVYYVDQIMIAIDQAAPTVNIVDPLNNTIIDNHIVYLEWLSADTGSNILKTIVKVNGAIVDVWNYIKNNQYLNLAEMFGSTPITVDIIDLAGNYGTDTIYLDLYLLLPEFTVDLPAPFYSLTEDFNFDVDIIDTRAGVLGVNMFIDSINVSTVNYKSSIRYTPFTIQMNITNLLYNVLLSSHSIEIVIIDSFLRETSYANTFYVDDEAPQIISPTLGTQTLGSSTVNFVIDDHGDIILYLNVTISDSHQINTISVRLVGTDYDETFGMTPEAGNTPTLGQYYIALDFTNLTLGDYTITITVTDTAGNIEAQSYGITMTRFTPVPWILQGNNLIYVSAGGGLVVLLTIILSVSLRKTVVNFGWKKDIVAVA
ncbi:MAG: Ig-like domain-containing protein, partial [Candidatus Heimdallarchaeota archaeon]